MKTPQEEYQEIKEFIDQHHISDSVVSMEESLEICIGYSQRIGELINQAQYEYSIAYAQALNDLLSMEEETETTRKAKLESVTAFLKKWYSDLKNLNNSLKSERMALMQAIKTRREEPYQGKRNV